MAGHNDSETVAMLPMGPTSTGSGSWSSSPVKHYLELGSRPIMYQEEGGRPEPVDARGDALAPLKVWSYSRKLWAQLTAEFLGMMIFQVYGGNAPDSVAAFGNGITLVIIVYATAHVSGGHVNPAVTFATCLTGHTSWGKGGLYGAAQVLGGIFGALFQSVLVPGVYIGMGDTGPGCFTHTKDPPINGFQLFCWEAFMTFTLVSVVYAVAVSKPGHGNTGPLAVGFTLFASAFVGGPYTGAALNPARVLGPALVFHCYWSHVFVYIFSELFGAACAAALVIPLYGFGQFGSLFDSRSLAWLGLSHVGVSHNPAGDAHVAGDGLPAPGPAGATAHVTVLPVAATAPAVMSPVPIGVSSASANISGGRQPQSRAPIVLRGPITVPVSSGTAAAAGGMPASSPARPALTTSRPTLSALAEESQKRGPPRNASRGEGLQWRDGNRRDGGEGGGGGGGF